MDQQYKNMIVEGLGLRSCRRASAWHGLNAKTDRPTEDWIGGNLLTRGSLSVALSAPIYVNPGRTTIRRLFSQRYV